jgi:hypothetical protein
MYKYVVVVVDIGWINMRRGGGRELPLPPSPMIVYFSATEDEEIRPSEFLEFQQSYGAD